ncbi:MAG: tyrosine--tRNA ligase, partial [Rhodospirillaceae bacterium]|nr:tyrosine--tRNA ligase [Rhodospirillaceae bacterium]
QFWRNTEDGDVGRFMRLFTDLPLDEIARYEALGGAEINEAKIILANEATSLAHGTMAAANAAETARKTFSEGGTGDSLPMIAIAREKLTEGVPLLDLLMEAGLCASKSEARRLIRGGGGRVNDVAVEDEARIVGPDDLDADGAIKLSAGRKRHALVRLA